MPLTIQTIMILSLQSAKKPRHLNQLQPRAIMGLHMALD